MTLIFTYHHLHIIQNYSVNQTIDLNDEYTYEIKTIKYFPFTLKEEYETFNGETIPWYFEKEWVPFSAAIKLAELDRFFSFPNDKNSGEVVISGILSREQQFIDHETVEVLINGEEKRPNRFSMFNIDQDEQIFTIHVELDEELASLNELALTIEGVKVTFDSLKEKEDKQMKLSPFFDKDKVIKEGMKS